MEQAIELPSRKQVSRIVEGSFTMLHALGSLKDIREEAEVLGYTLADHDEGWRLVRTFCDTQRPEATPIFQKSRIEKLAQLEKSVTVILARAGAGLGHYFPAQWEFIQDRLPERVGNSAGGHDIIPVLVAEFVIERLGILDQGTAPERAATCEQDRAAVQLLARRNIFNDEVRNQLQSLVGQIKKLPELDDGPSERGIVAAFLAHFEALQAWKRDWALTFRTGIANKRHLTSLGLYKPRRKRSKADVGPVPLAPLATS